MDDVQVKIQAKVLEQLLEHLRARPDVQYIDLMNLAGFCRNCLAKWYRQAALDLGQTISDAQARAFVYGMGKRRGKRNTKKTPANPCLHNIFIELLKSRCDFIKISLSYNRRSNPFYI